MTAAENFARFAAAAAAAADVAKLRDAAPKYTSTSTLLLPRIDDTHATLAAAAKAAYTHAMRIALVAYVGTMAETTGFDPDTVDFDESFVMIDKLDQAEAEVIGILAVMGERDFDPSFFAGVMTSLWSWYSPIALTPEGRGAADAEIEANS